VWLLGLPVYFGILVFLVAGFHYANHVFPPMAELVYIHQLLHCPNHVSRMSRTTEVRSAGNTGCISAGSDGFSIQRLVERFQSSNHTGCSKRPILGMESRRCNCGVSWNRSSRRELVVASLAPVIARSSP